MEQYLQLHKRYDETSKRLEVSNGRLLAKPASRSELLRTSYWPRVRPLHIENDPTGKLNRDINYPMIVFKER